MTGEPKKKPRVDRRKNVWKVAEVLAKNPNKTIREVAKEAWIGKTTAANSMKELGQNGTKDPTIAYIVGSSKGRLQRSQGIFDRWLDQIEEQDKIATKDIVVVKDIANDDMKRVTVFGGSVTDDNWGLNNVITPKQLEAIDSILNSM